MTKPRLSLLLLLLLPFLAAMAVPSCVFRLVDTSSGLPDNETRNVVRLPDGRWAVRTATGLSLFDGCTFRSFPLPSRTAWPMDYEAGQPTTYADAQGHIWTKEAGKLYVFDLLTERYVADVGALLGSMGIRGRVRNVFVDASGSVWIAMDDRLTAPAMTGKGKPKRARTLHVPTRNLRDVAVVGRRAWLAYGDGTVACMDTASGKPLAVRQKLWNHPVVSRDFVRFAQSGATLWLMWDRGVAVLPKGSHQWKRRLEGEAGQTFVALSAAADGTAFLAVRQRGVVVLHGDGSNSLIGSFPTTGGETVDDDVEAVGCLDGDLVLCLRSKGLCICNPLVQPFAFHPLSLFHVSWTGNYRLATTRDGKCLFCFPQGQLLYAPSTQTMTRMASGAEDATTSFTDSRGRIWTGTFRHGIYRDDHGQHRHYLQEGSSQHDTDYNIIRDFAEDARHRVWVTYLGGIGRFDERQERIVPLRNRLIEGNRNINAIAFDKQGWLYAATNDGLLRVGPDGRQASAIPLAATGDETADGLPTACKCLYVDAQGTVWAGTYGGLYAYEPSTRALRHFGRAEGMANEVVQDITGDGDGGIWATTANGLCRLQRSSTGSYALTVFDSGSFLGDSKFLPSAAASTGSSLVFGCANGFYVVRPSQVRRVAYRGRPLLTSLIVNNREVRPGMSVDGHVVLPQALPHTSRVVLRHDENFITVQFSGLNFDMPRHTRYRYRLRGVSDQWTETSPADGIGRATYANLAPGSYKLEVCSAGFDRQWSRRPATLAITVLAPWWATWWARTLYAALLIMMAAGAYRWKMRQNRRRMEEEKSRALDEMKYRFFTNISHEFRTLLTLIITPVSSLLSRVRDPDEKAQLATVSRNAADLLQLVNQLLDFRKMESGGEQLRLSGGNLDEFVAYTVAKFRPLAEQKGIALYCTMEAKGLFIHFDRDKVGKILGNLLSNALKFTDRGGRVTVTLSALIRDSHRWARLAVADNGCGIGAEDQRHIFDRFYRADSQAATYAGSGIGLNMVAEYVRLHQGQIGVESQPGKGSTFTVLLPAELPLPDSQPNDADSATAPATAPPANGNGKDKTVLVVEDNREFRSYLVGQLSHIYNKVEEAQDGIEGALKAEADEPDIIVSDVMMPRMSGTDMCRRLKDNIATSHIPVVLLTAWSSDEARAEGYKAGADAYIAKPFVMDVLLSRIDNLLSRQQQRIDAFSHNASLDPRTLTDSTADSHLLDEIIAAIKAHLADNEYTIDSLARDVALSRMSLYRKVRSLTGQTPADFIRTVRLKTAAGLLREGRCTVAEACWQTGFASPQNFSRHFKAMFGVLPSQYMPSSKNRK